MGREERHSEGGHRRRDTLELRRIELVQNASDDLRPGRLDVFQHLKTDRRDPNAVFVFDIEIVADARGRGLGRSAMLAAERFALDLGRKAVGLNVFGPNETARRQYDSLGYQVVSTSMTKHLDQSG